MLTVEEAKRIGIQACVKKIGYEFCKAHPDNGVSAYGEEREGFINCFVGVVESCPLVSMTLITMRREAPWRRQR